MKKLFSLSALVFLCAVILIFLTACRDTACEHSFGEWTVIDAPTCTKGGYSTRTCSLCGETTRTILYPSDHTYSEEWSFDGTHHWREAVCEHTGQTSAREPHTFDGRYCTVCGTVKASQGLAYRGDSESGTYIVTGLGTTLESDIVVARYYNGSDIVAVDAGAFANAKGLNSVWLQELITSIGDGAFAYSASLKEVTLSTGLEYMGSQLFIGCTSLERIVYLGTTEQFLAIEKADDWDGGVTDFVIECTDGELLPTPHTYSEEWSFDGTHHWREATCGHDFVVDYGTHNFVGSTCDSCGAVKATQGLEYRGNLVDGTYTVISLGTTLEADVVVAKYYNGKLIAAVGEGAFSNTKGLLSVWLQEYVLTVGDRAFANSPDLKTVTITNGTEYLGSELFVGCTSLEKIIFRGSVAQFNAIEKAEDWDSGLTGCTVECFDGVIPLNK